MVYLADCTPESEMARRILKEFLISKGWRVLPEREYSKETYADEARQDLQRALAFVQLLGEFRWRFGEFDVIQYRLAQELNIPMFRQRNPDLDLTRVEEEHRAFITGPGVVARGLEEFKDIVDRGLREKRRANLHAHHPPSPFARVLTSLRARAGDALWDQAFARCRENNVLLERVSGEEKLKDLCAAMPCHGFLLLCDEGAVADEALSNKPRLRECFAIQLEAATPPPVGVMFWPPPDQPPWSRLLPCSPEKLHCINGQMPDEEVRLAVSLQPTNLTTFVTEVRKLAS